jgi:hypothetical protein
LAEKTWAQALAALESGYAQCVVRPTWYHLDDGIKFVKGPEEVGGFRRTKAVFRANSIVKILKVQKDKIYRINLCGESNQELGSIEVQALIDDTENDICQKIASEINNRRAVAIAVVLEPRQILISPIATCHDTATIRRTGHSEKVSSIFINHEQFDLGKIKSSPSYTIERDGTTIRLISKQLPDSNSGRVFSVAVCNADNCIELEGGPRLTVELDAPIADDRPLAEIPGEVLDYAVVLRNDNPYIINVPSQWRYRPGINKTNGTIDYAIEKEKLSQSPFRRWVPAGTYMATYTRITTMEAANESGRHAVNAILRTLHQIGEPPDEREPLFNGQGKLFGDLCKIWDPEDNELADLGTVKALDEALMREGLPHVLDIFRVFEILENLPDDISMSDALKEIRSLIEDQFGGATAAMSRIGLSALEVATRAQIELMRMFFG